MITLMADQQVGDEGEARNIAYRCTEDEGVPWMSLSLRDWYGEEPRVLRREFRPPFAMCELLDLASSKYYAVGKMRIGKGTSTNQCMILARYGRIANVLDGVVGGNKAQWVYNRNSKEIIRLTIPMDDHVILRPSAFRASLSGSQNRMIIAGVVNAIEIIVYPRTSVNTHYGRIGECPSSDLMDHARGYADTPPIADGSIEIR